MLIKDKIKIDGATKKATIMRDGVYQYLGAEIGLDGEKASELFSVFRPKEEVKKAYDAFMRRKRIPVTSEHPEDFLNLEDEDSYKNGQAENPVLTSVANYDTLDCSLVLKDEALRDYQLDKREVSCGWDGFFEEAENEDYSFIQRFRDINHIAIVPEGRCGAVCKIKDKQGGTSMEENKKENGKTEAENKDVDGSETKTTDENGSEENNMQYRMNNGMMSELIEKVAEKLGVEDMDMEKAKEAIDEYVSEMSDEFKISSENADEDSEEKKTEDEDVESKKTEDEDGEEKEEEKENGNKVADKKVTDKAIKDAFEKGKKLGTSEAVKRFADVMPILSSGEFKLEEIKDKTACQIKSMFIEKTLGEKVNVSDAALDTTFKVAIKAYENPNWKKAISDSKSSDLSSQIDNIKFKK